MAISAIETRYAGCRFRSRLEARWAVFFDHIGARWDYEPQGFVIDGTPYLPDFLLTDCGTWVEVKGSGDQLDRELMYRAALHLPEMPYRAESGPRLMILGPIPEPLPRGDWGWIGLTPQPVDDGSLEVFGEVYGFGSYQKHLRPWRLYDTSCADSYTCGDAPAEWLVPDCDPYEAGPLAFSGSLRDAYAVARSARFEHGEAL